MLKDSKTHWLAKLLQYGVYLAAFVPLVIFSQFISPFHFGKVVVFRSIVEIMAVFYFILILKDRSFLPPRHPLLIVFAFFTLLFGISTITSVNPYLSFWGSLERMGGLWSFLHYLVYFVILISIFRKKEDWFWLLKIMVFVGVLSALYGFGQKTDIKFFVGSGGRERIFGTIGNPALFAGYQIVCLFLALILTFSPSVPSKQRPYFFVIAAINTVAALMTAVRGSVLGIGVGFLIFAFLYFVYSKSRVAKRVLISIIAVMILFVAFSLAFKNSDFVKSSGYLSRVTSFSLRAYTIQTRFWAWRAGLEGWRETPKTVLLGWGPENFNIPFSRHFNPKFFRGIGSETLFDRAHNMFIEILVTMGLLTFLAYLAMFIFIYRLLWKFALKEQKIDKVTGVGLISLITAYIIHNCFIFDTSANFLVFFTVLGFIVFLTSDKPAISSVDSTGRAANLGKQNLGPGLQTLMFLLILAVIFLIYRTNVLPAKANYTTTRAIIRSWAKDFDGAVAKFKEALVFNVPGKYEYRHRYSQYVLEYTSGKKIDEKEKQALLYGISEVQKNVEETKLDYLPYLYVSRMYIILGKNDPSSPYNDEALKNSMKALEISPTFVRTYYEIAQAYLNKKDYDGAAKYFQKAIDLNPEVNLSYWYLGALYIEGGELEKGLVAIEKARELGYVFSESDLLKLITIFLKSSNFVKIAELYQDLIKLNPQNPQHHASLAVAYAKIGRIDDAVAEAREAAALDETFEKEARMFVESLGRKF